MPGRADPVKIQKTSTLVALINFSFLPLYYMDTRLGLTTSMIVTGIMLQRFYELGKERRPGANLLNTVNTFFAPHTDDPSTELANLGRNVINGGAATFDEAATYVHKLCG